MRKLCFLNKSGFGLIEVLIGLVILTVVLIPMTGLIVVHYKQVADEGIKITALNLAQKMIEEFKCAKQITTYGPAFFTGETFVKYKYEVFSRGGNTYEIKIYYNHQGTDEPVASLTSEIATQ